MTPTGVLVMAYGTADGPADIERYYTDIRGGRPPSPEQLAELRERYAAIGNRFPLLETTRRVADDLEGLLNKRTGSPNAFRTYLGMKHSAPFISEAVARMREDGIEHAVGIVMAPHWARMSIDTYVDRVEKSVAEGGGPQVTYIRHWYSHPAFIAFLSERVRRALGSLPEAERARAAVIFSAHSLPVRTLGDGSRRCLRCDLAVCERRCEYAFQLRDTADLVARSLGLEQEVVVAWQSAGRTEDLWWGPSVEQVIADLAARGFPAVVVCSAGFVADHLETLYDLDLEAAEVAAAHGLRFVRTEMPNDDPDFVEALGQIVLDHQKERV